MAAELCEFKGQQFLVVVDYYSRYLDICFLKQTTSQTVIGHLKNVFASHGVPETFITDNGPQFSSREFKEFSLDWNFKHITSSPHFHQSNGAAERAVRTAKHILSQKEMHKALMVYRASPIAELKASPAELAFGRKLRTTLPMLQRNLSPKLVDMSTFSNRHEQYRQRQQDNYNRHHGVRPLSCLAPGDPVLIKLDGQKGWRKTGEIMKPVANRSYLLKTTDGAVLRRNRQHLRPHPNFQQQLQMHDPSPIIVRTPPPAPPPNPTSPVAPATSPTPAPAAVPCSPVKQPSATVSRYGRKIIPPLRFRNM